MKEDPTHSYGMCYIIIPDQIYMRPFVDILTISLASNFNSEDKRKMILQISSNDTYHTLSSKMSDQTNQLMEYDFIGKNTYLSIEHTETSSEYIKDCSEIAFFKCWADNIVKTNQFNCTNKCIPLSFNFLMEFIGHRIPRCSNDQGNFLKGIDNKTVRR